MPEVELTPAEATWLLRAGMRAAGDRMRNGLRLTPEIEAALRRLAAIADQELTTPTCSASRTRGATLGSFDEVTVGVAADLVGTSESYIQRLARAGRVRSRKVGRSWLIDVDSLRSVLRRTDDRDDRGGRRARGR